MRPSDWTAASITPGKPTRADTRRDDYRVFNDDRSAGDYDNSAVIGMAFAIGASMPTGAASSFGVGCVKAEDSACKQNCT